MSYQIEEIKNKILCSDVLETLRKFPSDSIDMVITSPPYYGLRKNLSDDDPNKKYEIGLENSFEEFMDKMMEVMKEIKRVMKPTGTCWINFGDAYGGSGMGVSYARHTKGPNSVLRNDLSYMPAVGHSRGRFDKCLLMMPERFAIRCIDQLEFVLRNKIIWAKQVMFFNKDGSKYTKGSVMPISAKDRFNQSYEYLFFFTKSKKYYSNLDAVRIPTQVVGINDMRPDGILRQKLYPESKYNKFNYRVRDAEKKAGQPQFKASKEEIEAYKQKEAEGYKTGSKAKRYNEVPSDYGKKKKGIEEIGSRWMSGTPNYTYQGKFAGREDAELFNSPRARTQRNKVNDPRGTHFGGPGSWRDFKDENESFINPLGKNIPTVHLIAENNVENLAEQLHNWYLEITQELNSNSFNPNAQKKYADLTEEQKNIDIYIASKILTLFGNSTLPVVFQINPEPHNFQKELGKEFAEHFSIFPEKLLEVPILFGCPPNGIVLDPFMGSGTTAIVAKKLGRNFIGIELNKNYVKLAEKRLAQIPKPLL